MCRVERTLTANLYIDLCCLKPVVVACTHAKLKQHEDCPSQASWSLNDILLTFVIAFGTMIADHNTFV